MFRSILVAISLILSGPAFAQQIDEAESWIGDDVFLAGNDVVHKESGADDLFMAGETLRVEAPISGTAHMAGRLIVFETDVGADVYAAGMNIEVNGAVSGDATLAGYDVIVAAPIGGDLRAAASKIRIDAPISGTAVLTGEVVTLNSVIDGDVALTAGDLVFGANSRINGTLTIYDENPDRIDVPESVAAVERIERRAIEQWSEDQFYIVSRPSWYQLVGGFIGGILVVAAVATLLVAIASGPVARLRERALDKPFRVVWFGFLSLSAVIGSGFVLAMTVIGLLILPAAVIAAVVLALIGYVLGTYILGVGVWGAIGKPMPANLGTKAIAALIGSTLAGLIGLVPFLGWLFILALVLIGVGALTVSILRPVFFSISV